MTKQTFLRGTFLLIMTGLITKVLGVLNRIVIARVIGEEGMGLYMMAYPTLLLTVTLTQLGLPVAISKMVSEAEAVNDKQKVKQILVVSLSLVSLLSVIFTTLMIVLTPGLPDTYLQMNVLFIRSLPSHL